MGFTTGLVIGLLAGGFIINVDVRTPSAVREKLKQWFGLGGSDAKETKAKS